MGPGNGVLSLALGLLALALQAADARPRRLTDHTSSTTAELDENGLIAAVPPEEDALRQLTAISAHEHLASVAAIPKFLCTTHVLPRSEHVGWLASALQRRGMGWNAAFYPELH